MQKRNVKKQSFQQPSIPRCENCNIGPQNKNGFCFSCLFLPIIQNLDWITCPQCGKEWSKLKDSGICIACDNAKWLDFNVKKSAEEKFKKIFGSIQAMNYYTFQKFKVSDGNQEAFEKLSNFDSNKENVYLWGSAGTGKTHLAYACAKAYALNGKRVVISTPLRMVDTFRTKSQEEKENHFDNFTECDILLVDDLGVSRYTDFGLEIICELLNRRTLQLKYGLIVTSNLSLDALSNKLKDDRLTSRLAGMCDIIKLSGHDHRLKENP